MAATPAIASGSRPRAKPLRFAEDEHVLRGASSCLPDIEHVNHLDECRGT